MKSENSLSDILDKLRQTEDKNVLEDALRSYGEHEDDIKAFLAYRFHELSGNEKSEGAQQEAARIFKLMEDKLEAEGEWGGGLAKGNRKQSLWLRIAAVVVVVLGAAFLLRILTRQTKIAADYRTDNAAVINTKPHFDTIRNTGVDITAFRLSDGTSVKLHPGSFIAFEKTLKKQNKKVYLSGMAVFSVKKDKYRPFSVFSGGFEVRDLGTVFSVNSSGMNLKVRLIKGKVIVHSLVRQRNIGDIAMVPGQIFEWDNGRQNYTLNLKTREPAPSHPNEKKNTVAMVPETVKLRLSYSFKNAALGDVLDALNTSLNGTDIIYKEADIRGKSFTGDLSKGMTLSYIMQTICRPHSGLEYKTRDRKIYIESTVTEPISN